jgi:hypothetical protein
MKKIKYQQQPTNLCTGALPKVDNKQQTTNNEQQTTYNEQQPNKEL